MKNKAVSSRDSGLVTLNVRPATAEAVRDLARSRGMLQYRMVELLLNGWDMLTEQQQVEAHKQLRSVRETVSA